MSRMPAGVPTPNQIAEEPLRPLLATVRAAGENLLHALYAEYPDGLPEADPMLADPMDPALWTAPALAQALESLLEMLGLHDQALIERNARWRRKDTEF